MCKLYAQNTLTINLKGEIPDTVNFIGLEQNENKFNYLKNNDSTLSVYVDLKKLDRLTFVINSKQRWWYSIWIEPDIKNKEIEIDYNNKTVTINNKSKIDSAFIKIFEYDNRNEIEKTCDEIKKFITLNPSSYFSLWLFTHTYSLSFVNVTVKKQLFELLSKQLELNSDYKKLLASFKAKHYPTIGDELKEFKLENFNNLEFDSEEIKQKWILINFWSTKCLPCVKEIDSLILFNKLIDTTKVKFISISVDDLKKDWINSTYSKKINWTSLWQENGFFGELVHYYNLYSLPTFILFNKNKKLEFIKDGSNELYPIKDFFRINNLCISE